MRFFTKTRAAVIAAIVVAGGAAVTYAASPGNARGMASVDIKYSSLERITKAVEEVFNDAGFTIVEQSEGSIVFERPGSRWKDLSYGGIDGGVIERAVVDIEERTEDLFWVGCDVYMVKGRDSEFGVEDQTKVMKAFGREYQKLLNKVKTAAEARPMKVIRE